MHDEVAKFAATVSCPGQDPAIVAQAATHAARKIFDMLARAGT